MINLWLIKQRTDQVDLLLRNALSWYLVCLYGSTSALKTFLRNISDRLRVCFKSLKTQKLWSPYNFFVERLWKTSKPWLKLAKGSLQSMSQCQMRTFQHYRKNTSLPKFSLALLRLRAQCKMVAQCFLNSQLMQKLHLCSPRGSVRDRAIKPEDISEQWLPCSARMAQSILD